MAFRLENEVKNFCRKLLKPWTTERQLRHDLTLAMQTSAASKASQLGLVQQWKRLRRGTEELPLLNDVEFRAFSQNGEDGILLYIFSLIGAGEKRRASR